MPTKNSNQYWYDSKLEIKTSIKFATLPSFIFLAPGAGYTHWKQTVFYFPDYATIKRDEVLEGIYYCKVNLENTVCFLTQIFLISTQCL